MSNSRTMAGHTWLIFSHSDCVAARWKRKCDMKKQLLRAFAVAALLATGMATQTVWAADDPEDCPYGGWVNPSGRLVCCDPGGC